MVKNPEYKSTKAWHRGGVARSSVDGAVMAIRAKGLRWFSRQPISTTVTVGGV
jgi:hypothetical protein